MSEQRRLGSYYTVGNPFTHAPFREWMASLPTKSRFVEPYCGSGAIPRLMEEAGHEGLSWSRYDVNPEITDVTHQDTIRSFPEGFDVVVTNPPYLSHHFAKRKGVDIDRDAFRGYASLYQSAIHAALAKAPHVAMIIPESFLTSGLFRERLEHVVSLPYAMFDDTEMPTCLALWGPTPTPDFLVHSGEDLLGPFSEVARPLEKTPCSRRVTFNVLSGQLGLRATDRTVGPTIEFCDPLLIPAENVKVSARLVSRISLDVLPDQVPAVQAEANQRLGTWRRDTHDVLLTAFKGTRTDGLFRRRLDFANARALLSQAICQVRECRHEEETLDLWGTAHSSG